MTIHFETLGCRLNQDETEGAARAFEEAGFTTHLEPLTASDTPPEKVILSVINTCTVTGKAEQKARRIIRLLLEKFPHSPVLVTGCYAQVDAPALKAINEERVSVLPGTQKQLLANLAAYMGKEKKSLTAKEIDAFVQTNTPTPQKTFTLYTPVFAKHSRGSVKIQDGCDCACSFCKIHFARGKSVSLESKTVIERIQELEKNGIGEVVLTGVNLSQYTSLDEKGEKINLPSLIEKILENTKSIKIRLSSLYPQSVNDQMCRALSSPRVQPFFHLSIQSGSDSILKAMRRPHNVDAVTESIKKLREAKNNPFISCDIIAGFPGESEEDFAQTKELCEKADFAWIHAFPFSPRPGTPAEKMKPQIPERIKDERVRWLTEKAIEGKLAYIKSFEGKTLSATVENSRSDRKALLAKSEKTILHAVTENFLHVEIKLEEGERIPAPGEMVTVKITSALEKSIRDGKEAECAGTLV